MPYTDLIDSFAGIVLPGQLAARHGMKESCYDIDRLYSRCRVYDYTSIYLRII